MSKSIFQQNVIAVIWDFDKTLIPGYMQEPIFQHYGIDGGRFWDEVNALPRYYRERGVIAPAKEMMYLNHIITYAQKGIFKGLSNSLLRELGAKIEFYPGLPGFFDLVRQRISGNPEFEKHEIRIEHYIVSTGLRQMVMGSKIASYVDGIWACEFIEKVAPPGFREEPLLHLPGEVEQIACVIDNTSKTRALFEINKGSNKHEIDVNAHILPGERRVPFPNMVYIADGPSDVPVFSLLNKEGGRTYAVYKRANKGEFQQVKNLQQQGRIQGFGEADYTENSHTGMWILNSVEEIAYRMVSERERSLGERVGKPPRHLNEK